MNKSESIRWRKREDGLVSFECSFISEDLVNCMIFQRPSRYAVLWGFFRMLYLEM